ncbi:MAG: TolC family protein [Hydrogenophaga sp.]|uniref:TolC family protein n=1 Tax=Hydrogenophaga sp. TaxID=1904254 RepID=UPI0026212B90|nr:TolC family protein [Hydrogenophaga sp.]MDM7942444.1 TolC family protein [Hydrogenophaga sp.]
MKLLFLVAVCVVPALALANAPAPVPSPGPDATSPAPAASPADSLGPNTPLTPQALVRLVAVRNAAAVNAGLQQAVSSRLFEAEQALYSPRLLARVRTDSVNRPRSTDEFTQLTELINPGGPLLARYKTLDVGFQFKLPSGALLDLSHQLNDRKSNLFLPPNSVEYAGTLSLVLKQPLLRNAGRSATEADLRIAELDAQLDVQRFSKEVLESAGEGMNVFWQLHRAIEGLSLREVSMGSLRKLSADVASRVDAGFAPRTELLDMRIALSARETELVRAQRAVLESQSRMRGVLNLGADTPAEASFVPQLPSVVAPITREEVSLRLEKARSSWPVLQLALLRRQQEGIRLQFARNQALPDLSLELGFNHNSLRDRLNQTWKDSFSNKHPGWFAAISLDMPLNNQRGDARLAAQTVRVEQADAEVQAADRSLSNDLLTRFQQLQSTLSEARLQGEDVRAREALLVADQAQYQLGRARIRQVLEREDDLNESRLRLLDSEVRVELARLALMLADGSLLDQYGVDIQR